MFVPNKHRNGYVSLEMFPKQNKNKKEKNKTKPNQIIKKPQKPLPHVLLSLYHLPWPKSPYGHMPKFIVTSS